jgi:hypothetical protein
VTVNHIVTVNHPIVVGNPLDRTPPTVAAVQTVGGPQGIFEVIVTFSKPMDPARAQNPQNYAYILNYGTFSMSLGVATAAYDPASRRVVLFLASPVPPGASASLVVSPNAGAAPGRGLTDLSGNLLDGTGTGRFPGTPFVTLIR